MRTTSTHTLLILVLASMGCQSPTFIDRLRSCDLLGDGYVGALPFYQPNQCYERCYAEATCEELEDALCSDAIVVPLRCDQACAFRCPDGSLLPVESECNGVQDCASGADEAQCAGEGDTDTTPYCPTTGYTRCDGVIECTDGYDEAMCPFTCPDGRVLAHSQRCDGIANCRDGWDEQGCAELHRCL